MCDAQNASNGRFCGVASARTKGFAVVGGGGGGAKLLLIDGFVAVGSGGTIIGS